MLKKLVIQITFSLLGLGALSISAQAQGVYRIVGPDGKVTFSDKPSLQAPGKALDIRVNAAESSNANFSYELRQATSQFPVVLYSTRNCASCDAGRRMLQQRGIPFSEKTVNSTQDLEALQKLGGNASLPFLTIGSQKIQGYSEAEWQQYLSAAAYPEQNSLPANYRPVTPTALVEPVQPTPKKTTKAPLPKPDVLPPPLPVAPSNPAGIQF